MTAESGEALEELRRDFAAFGASDEKIPRVTLGLCGRDCPPPPGASTWSWRGFGVRRVRGGRLIRYDDGAWARWDYRARSGTIHASARERLRELAYLAALSRAGEELDRRGLHRVHALGVSGPAGAGLVLLPSGGGKSTLALELLRRRSLGLLSDECPLVSSDGVVRPFLLRLALRPGADVSGLPPGSLRRFQRRGYEEKRLLDAAALGAEPGVAAPLRWLLVGSPSQGEPRLEPLSRAGALAALVRSLVVGVGLPQMAEYMARAEPALGAIAASRLRAACVLAGRARLARFRLGSRGPAASARFLEGVLAAA
ncbi:MAG TPA: hypothetical protein VH309_15230 [Elusimicrobiota bacterium]|nr:hypothetical protein [Elusimicrobiota bacterium]